MVSEKESSKKYNIVLISDIIFEPYFMPLMKLSFGNNINIYFISHKECYEDKYINQLKNAEFIVIWLNFEILYPNAFNIIVLDIAMKQQIIEAALFQCKRLHAYLLSYSNAKIVWLSFEDYYVQLQKVKGDNYNDLIDKLNIKINEILGENNESFIDLKYLIASVGIMNAYDTKGKYRWNAPYSQALVEVAVKEIRKQYLIEKGATKKCLILDCDNVLWGGILSEDGIENIKLGASGFGRSYQDFQRFVLELYYYGVILAICSKNDLSSVLTVFREHNEMILKEENIACFQVNWRNKVDNIKEIANNLNIELQSMVFVDDSPFEIEAIKNVLPEVTVVLYERDTIYTQLSCFNLKNETDLNNIEKRNQTYRTNQMREISKAKYSNFTDYIASLEMNLDIHEALPIEYNRISELSQRTNKCTNGQRYSVYELKHKLECCNYKLYSVTLSDKFCNLGIIGAIGFLGEDVDLFCLSCRALGRNIEKSLIDYFKSESLEKIINDLVF